MKDLFRNIDFYFVVNSSLDFKSIDITSIVALLTAIISLFAAIMARRSAKAAEKQIANEYERRRQDHIINLFSLQFEFDLRIFKYVSVNIYKITKEINIGKEESQLFEKKSRELLKFLLKYRSTLRLFKSLYPHPAEIQTIDIVECDLMKIQELFNSLTEDIMHGKIIGKGDYYTEKFISYAKECSNHLDALLTPQSPQA